MRSLYLFHYILWPSPLRNASLGGNGKIQDVMRSSLTRATPAKSGLALEINDNFLKDKLSKAIPSTNQLLENKQLVVHRP